MFLLKNLKITAFLTISCILLYSCGTGADARKYPPNPELRVKKNMEEGRGFRLMDTLNTDRKSGTSYEFASSNELWRAALDTLDFMPLTSVNYSGGIIVTDWYTNDENSKESIKISVRFLTNEIRSDAINVKIFKRICADTTSCKISESYSDLKNELTKKILKIAKTYEVQNKDKNFKPYKSTKLKK
tara:strand:- start:116 stop:676 length:561 start_codon:yes stop_codon:yes gene_type:complete